MSQSLEAVYANYVTALARAPLSAQTLRTYASKVRGYLAWLEVADVDGDPLTEVDARDWAVRDYRTYLTAVLKRANATTNNALAAVDDFYTRTGLGPAKADRLQPATQAPRALTGKAVLRWLRAANATESTRDRALALTPFYAGARIGEIVALDVADVRLSARKGTARLYGKGGKPRVLDLHPELRTAYANWLTDRADWPGVGTQSALFLNRAGHRLGTRGASAIFNTILASAGLDDDASAHVLRHTFATTLIRGGTDLVVVADMLGHTRLDQTRRYALPTTADRERALNLLPTDH
ncbi:MAG: tyrosine-type recombinase/integrase [Phycicoccus sp.]|nr:tyrosine-type recombinase/integrase [Phycicoccus sp.]